ncbi:sensor domain-containing protein [Photobacterium phosphoreum]|jgi:diguanylate cyclase (GGDEF)-like protein|uniref:sensor domain-containing protein n=1 Tax=Photobacterium phosphoreum TaxID=659 RepID=UPI0007F8D769|nr:GGDEF and EAL domain-containing protein [Photobacterium phosphoreum]MCD9463972.1 c-di-GMP phosphodiesterase [Photobacterium phosphoreum]MCD9471290.1 c-di-GMP phosphodiesterase [Photobacterium phosphoreum]MCD9502012.1 EAL domain-containing protein [Photobacterium phosphoreum]MCD9506632.1 EAL domain-containing protein [Photobacterium phosphoreum]OBU27667.1 c-di-GMP phosphodiesterase [Photobacterium phosphoreum]
MQIEQLDYWFPLLTNNSPFLFAILDDQHRYHCVNNRYSDISGKPQHQLIGSNDIDTLGSHYYQCLKPYYERAFKGEVIEAEIIINDTSHHTNLHISLAPLLNRLGKIEHIILHSVDTSERHVLINSLQESEHQLNQLQNLVTDGICVIEKNIIINANQRAIELLGMTSKNALLGQTLDHVLLDNNKQPCHSKTLTQASNNGNQHYYSANHNASSPLMLTTSPITMMGEAALLIKLTPALNNDVQQHKIEQLTQLDPLTGLYNRHGFSRQLDQLMQANTPLFMLYIDIDNFKNINDSLGHHIGDKVLQEIAQRLQQLLPKNAIIGHLSGDEFAVLLTHPEHENSGKIIAEQIIALVNQPFDLCYFSKHLACSIGMVKSPGNGHDARMMLQNADTAMYEAKNRGRNRLVIFSEPMSKAVRMRLWLEIELQKALQNNGLEVWYQPKVNAKNFEIDGAEALVRWKHPVEGYISPAQFIPVAERSGLIEQLGRVVMREVFTTVNQWKKQQLLKGRVAINLSSLQFENPKLIHFVDKLRQSTGINAADFTFELTESTVMNDGEHTIQMLNAIKQQGFALSIDDFGTGYSSLSYLARFPLDELKIDRAFIKDIDTIPKQITLIENIINLGKSLNMSVVAEGIETRQQATLLSNLNCDYIQGFHFHRPMPKQELEAILLKEKNYVNG